MVIESEDSGLFEMLITQKQRHLTLMYLRMIQSNKVINCVWFIQTACGLILGVR